MTDLHSHILFGVDDGARNPQESIEMLQRAAQEGVTCIVATPHALHPAMDTQPARRAFRELQPFAGDMGIEMRLGYECNLSALRVDDLAAARRFCIEKTNVLLVEFPFDNWPGTWREILYGLQAEGMRLVLAHPERYRPIQRDPHMLDSLAEMGVRLQVNAASLQGWFGAKQGIARRIVKAGRIAALGSDAHSAQDYAGFARIARRVPAEALNPAFL